MLTLFINSILLVANDTSKIMQSASDGNYLNSIFQVLIMTALGGTGLYKLVEYIIKQRSERKAKEDEAKLKRQSTEQDHENTLETELFKFDKEKYLKIQEGNENFQKQIINEIFSKFVSQTEWVTKLHDKTINELSKIILDIEKTAKDIYVQHDLLSNRIRSIDDKLVKNTNIIIAKLETLITLLKK